MKNTITKLISIIIPVFNEAQSLEELVKQIIKNSEDLNPLEIIFIDDGSTDNSLDIIKKLSREHPFVKYISLLKNYGKSAAYMAGFETAHGKYIITLDADLQDSPEYISKLVKELDNGFDLVVGWKQGRLNNEPVKAVPSRFYNCTKSLLFGLKIHDSNCGLKAMRQEVASELNLHGDQYRFIPELSHSIGFKVTEIPVMHQQRKYGHSKYGPGRFFTGLMDILTVRFLTAFTRKPLHFFGTIGFIMFFLGGSLEVYVLIRKFAGSLFRTHIACLVIGVMLIILSCQLFATGLIAEMLAHISRKKSYTIRENNINE